MNPDAVAFVVLSALGIASIPVLVWYRAQKRIRHLEMSLLAQTTDVDRYEELRLLLERLATQTEQLADQQALLAERLIGRRELLPPGRSEQPAVNTPH
ncbi:MAG: hypothetical protein ABI742_07810 [Gemmatimonadota bacterium]